MVEEQRLYTYVTDELVDSKAIPTVFYETGTDGIPRIPVASNKDGIKGYALQYFTPEENISSRVIDLKHLVAAGIISRDSIAMIN